METTTNLPHPGSCKLILQNIYQSAWSPVNFIGVVIIKQSTDKALSAKCVVYACGFTSKVLTIYYMPLIIAAVEDNTSVLSLASKTIMEACVEMDIPSIHDGKALTEHKHEQETDFSLSYGNGFGDCS